MTDNHGPSRDILLSLHTSGLEDFLERERMGYVEDRERVAGFQSHRFQRMPQIAVETDQPEWLITRLELISLLKHKTPVAYVSRDLPRMDKLKHVPTRPLDDFEDAAVRRLQYDEDVVTEESLKRIRMVGSLRAGKDCLACHSVRRGHLLGAFSYKLHRSKPIEPSPQPEPTAGPQARWDQAGESLVRVVFIGK